MTQKLFIFEPRHQILKKNYNSFFFKQEKFYQSSYFRKNPIFQALRFNRILKKYAKN